MFKSRVVKEVVRTTEVDTKTREYSYDIANFHVDVTSFSGSNLSEVQKFDLKQSRIQYKMWGDLDEDFFYDDIDSKPTTRIYRAVIYDIRYPEYKKILYMRKSLHSLNDEKQPGEVDHWAIAEAGKSGDPQFLEDFLNQCNFPKNYSVISRASSGSEGIKPDNFDGSAMGSLAFASIQLSAIQEDPNDYWFAILNPELEEKIFSFKDKDQKRIKLNFTKLSEYIKEFGFSVVMQRVNGVVSLQREYPGYWFDLQSIKGNLLLLLQRGTITLSELNRLVGKKTFIDNVEAVDFFSNPKNTKYLVPLFKSKPEVFQYFLKNVADGPVLSLLDKDEWLVVNQQMMKANI